MPATRATLVVLGALAAIASAGCYADAPTYAGCSDTIACASDADACFHVLVTRTDGSTGDASFCSRGCARHDDCPGDALCLQLVGDAASRLLCYETCVTSDDCYSPLVCTPTTGAPGDPSVCMP